MNIYFTKKYKNLENYLKEQKNKIKLIENNLIIFKNQENDIRYLKCKVYMQEKSINTLEEKINNLNNQLFYSFIFSILFLIKILKDILI